MKNSTTTRIVRLFLSAVASVTILFTVSCTPEENPALTVKPSVSEMKFSADGKTVTAGGNEMTPEFTVETNQAKWEVALSEKDSWLKVSETTSGFKLSADENTAAEDRTPITVTVKAGKASPVTIKVTQSGKTDPVASLSVTPSIAELKFSADGEKVFDGDTEVTPVFTVQTNQTSWDAVAFPAGSWLKLDKSATGFTLSADENTSTDERGPITVTVTAGEADPVTITVNQSGKPFVNPLPGAVISITATDENDSDQIAYFWRDGQVVKLSDKAQAYGVASVGSDIYVIGSQERSFMSYPVFWKNGEITDLPIGDAEGAQTSFIIVSDGDVYIGGQENGMSNSPLCWKNGELVSRIDVEYEDVIVYGMAISGSDIYMAGAEYDNDDYATAVYWKNGQKVTLSGGEMSAAIGIGVVGSDVYVGGAILEEDETMKLGYWKNGEFNLMWESEYEFEPSAMTMSGTDVYICGYIERGDGTIVAVYWKNDTLVELDEDAIAINILIDGSDVYVTGSVDEDDSEIVACWKNGTRMDIAGLKRAGATGITILK